LIFLTGDVHNDLGPKLGKVHNCINEITAALQYARLAADCGMKATLFVTGLGIREQPEKIKSILSLGNVEFGGHGWDSLKNHTVRTALWSICGSRYGPKAYQRYEIQKTVNAFKTYLGRPPLVWRGHAYYADQYTYELLCAAGVRVVSDEVVCFGRREASIEHLSSGLWSVPINTMPDHDTVMHGSMSQADVDAGRRLGCAMRDLQPIPGLNRKQRLAILIRQAAKHAFNIREMPYSAEYLYINNDVRVFSASEWESRLFGQIEAQLEKSGFATLLLHPICMAALDEMQTLRRILAFCRRFPTGFVGGAARVQ
jgi:peptidoglycan/xylan/chitin deacetylase (PgdA/CDA1 family)